MHGVVFCQDSLNVLIIGFFSFYHVSGDSAATFAIRRTDLVVAALSITDSAASSSSYPSHFGGGSAVGKSILSGATARMSFSIQVAENLQSKGLYWNIESPIIFLSSLCTMLSSVEAQLLETVLESLEEFSEGLCLRFRAALQPLSVVDTSSARLRFDTFIAKSFNNDFVIRMGHDT
ncbi:MAG: hypothetical protein EZS28_004190 [Streblomastix strix]|uniref:Uncharacterized protein n=1 Tax=Streblomastix strix TaxID=222440 RepID=A0A5J4WZC6_9EUKA|nr:MAG: hypothetical protein EZS28_004190 [Streblomastix strix]